MLRRAFSLLVASLALSACGYRGAETPSGPIIGAPIPIRPQAARPLLTSGGRVAILAPLSGPRAEIGQALVRAAQLALDTPGAPPLDEKDTGGTPQGAAEAARAAIAAGAGVILGPLTSTETAAVSPIARQAGVAVLAFTNDAAQAQPGIWPLGITPAQQVHRLAGALQAQGKTKLAALLPENDFGRAMADGLAQSATSLGLPPPSLHLYPAGAAINVLNPIVREMSAYAQRRGPLDAQIRAARASGTAEGRRHAATLARQPIPPAPFDALLLAETGEELEAIAALVAYYDIDQSAVRVLGPSLWAAPNSGASHLPRAWYAAPDPAARAAFEQAYTAKFGAAPPTIADIAFDAASIARAGGFTRPEGFSAASGLLALQPDGRTRRGLAIFEIQRGGPQMIEPAPASLSAPGV